jgi:hypothetical protein
MAPSYTANNAVLINSAVTSGALQISTPAAYAGLSFLLTAGGGSGSIQAVIRHANGIPETNALPVPDWFNGASPAFTVKGRVDVQSYAFDNVGASNPRFYSVDVTLIDAVSPVTNVVFNYVSGGNHCILAVSGSTGGAFTPVTVAGYTRDMIVEAAAPKFGALAGKTTATIENGAANTGATWYEAGYLSFAANTGLPAAGSLHTNFFYPDHQYVFAPGYTSNNAVFLSAGVPTASLVPSTPATFSALSFLTASCRGPVTISCLLRYDNGTVQSRNFVSPDWSNQAPSAVVANGRVNVSSGIYDAVAANNPRLYSVDFAVANTTSPITNITLSFSGGAAGANAAILAVSGIPGTVAPILVQQPQSLKGWENAPVLLSAPVAATAPLSCQWQRYNGSAYVNLVDGANLTGAVSTNLLLSPVSMADAGDYRLVASNPGGAVTSAVATVTVMSALPDLTRAGDGIANFGGGSPAGETMTNAINDTTSKYLNFGLNGGAGTFSGPVGFIVTPSVGPCIARALRFYTANDEPGRDPASYALYGSTDGGASYLLIITGSLSLPAGRNPAGLALNPLTQFVQQVTFNNSRSFSSYRVSFNTIKTNSASMMQIGEVEILGAPVFAVQLVPSPTPGMLIVRSPVAGRLWSTAAFEGSNTIWQSEGPINGEVLIPANAAVPARFYRVSVP